MPTNGWRILAVIVAGVAGTITNSAVVATYIPNEFIPLATSPGRIGVAVAVAVLLPLIYAFMTGPGAVTLALLALMVIPSALAKLVFGAGAPLGHCAGLQWGLRGYGVGGIPWDHMENRASVILGAPLRTTPSHRAPS
jgi:hypothetical protein